MKRDDWKLLGVMFGWACVAFAAGYFWRGHDNDRDAWVARTKAFGQGYVEGRGMTTADQQFWIKQQLRGDDE